MSSAGGITVGGALRSASAAAKLKLPTLPQYIRKMTVILDSAVKLRVIPVLIPTVETAEAVSNMTSESGSPSEAHMMNVAAIISVRLVMNTAVALFSASF